MATINRFEDLDIWQEARRLAKEIHILSEETKLKTEFKLRDQINGYIRLRFLRRIGCDRKF